MASTAALLINSGPAKSGKPCPRFTALYWLASAVISAKMVVLKPLTRFAIRFIPRSPLLIYSEGKDIFKQGFRIGILKLDSPEQDDDSNILVRQIPHLAAKARS